MITFKKYLQEKISKFELDELEKILDKIAEKFKLDIEFTAHFLQRTNDARNKTDITIEELDKIFKETLKKFGKKLSNNVFKVKSGENIEGVLNDIQTAINIPFVLAWNREKKELEIVSKTILRKKNFFTKDRKFKV